MENVETFNNDGDPTEEDQSLQICDSIECAEAEKMMQESIDITKESEEILKLEESGNLSDIKLKSFKIKTNRYLSSLSKNTIISSGLQNDKYLRSGLLNLKTDIKGATIGVMEIAKKAIANIAKFFSDIFIRILTKTSVLEKKLSILQQHLAKSPNELEISFASFRSIFMHFEMVSLANGWDKKTPRIPDIFAELVDLISTMKTSKIPKIETSSDTLVNIKDYVNYGKTTLESELIDYFIKNDSRAKEFELSRNRMKVIRVAKDRVDYAIFSEDEREVILMHMRSDRDPKVRMQPFSIIEKNNVSILLEAVKEAIRALKGQLKTETEKRLAELKKASMEIMSRFENATSDIKSSDIDTKWDELSKDIKNIWSVYPSIGNKSLLNLFYINNTILDWLISVNKIEMEASSKIDLGAINNAI